MNLFAINKKMRFVHLLILVLNVVLAFEGDLEINESKFYLNFIKSILLTVNRINI